MATINDIYAGMPDAKDEMITDEGERFFESFIVPPGLPTEQLLNGKKCLVSGFKGVGKTSVLYYLENEAKKREETTITSFVYFKSDFSELRKSAFESIANRMISVVDMSADVNQIKVEYLYIWRWVFFKKIVDDLTNGTFENVLFEEDDNWHNFVKSVNKINYSSENKNTISLSALSLSVQASSSEGLSASAEASFESSPHDQIIKFSEAVDKCESYFKLLKRTAVPYYIFIDEMEVFYGSIDLLKRDLTLIRDLIFTIHRLNSYKIAHFIAAIRNEVVFAMDRFIQTNEINKIIDGYSAPIRWYYSNTNSIDHPIIQVLMKRISLACGGVEQHFYDWFPEEVNGKDTVSYILDNGWNKPRDIVRLLMAAQNDSLHCSDTSFSQASFDTLRKEYSKNSLAEIRQELQSLYTSEEIEMILKLLRGGERIFNAESLRKKAPKGSKAREFINERYDDIIEDFYRVGFWGNVKRIEPTYHWRWNHKQDTGVLTTNGWELVIHPALYSELSISFF